MIGKILGTSDRTSFSIRLPLRNKKKSDKSAVTIA
jgi:hypothetical protein